MSVIGSIAFPMEILWSDRFREQNVGVFPTSPVGLQGRGLGVFWTRCFASRWVRVDEPKRILGIPSWFEKLLWHSKTAWW